MIYKYAIDFGTTNSSVAIRVRDERAKTESTVVCKPTVLSVVYVDENTDESNIALENVGKEAKEVFPIHEENQKALIREIKMAIDLEKELVTTDSGLKFHTVFLAAAILRKLKVVADSRLEQLQITAQGVVMGVPVSFSDRSKAMLRRALVSAGFYRDEAQARQLTEFVSEPVAVAVSYGLKVEDKKNVLVFDFGGGTLDVAILQLTPQGNEIDSRLPHDVLSKERLSLGGEDLNRLLYSKVFLCHYRTEMEQYRQQFGISPDTSLDDAKTVWAALSKTEAGVQLQERLESLKQMLSTEPIWDFAWTAPNGMTFPKVNITQSEFEDALNNISDDIENLVQKCLDDAGLNYFDIDDVLLAGGSSLIPFIQNILIEEMRFGNRVHGCDRKKIVPSDVLTSIVKGLSVYACKVDSKRRSIVEDIVDSDYGVWDTVQHKVSVILKKGTRFSDTEHQKTMATGGCYKDYEAVGNRSSSIPLDVYEVAGKRESKLGKIDLNRPGSGFYRIFMRVDSQSGCLVVDIYDRQTMKWYDDIPLEDREFELSV